MIKGVGSVVDIMPSTDYLRFVPKGTPEERMRATWQRVGNSIRNAMGHYTYEQQQDTHK
jgi:hypothetical protein